jgi:uncharacterized repeat protein (TIGR03803 family)
MRLKARLYIPAVTFRILTLLVISVSLVAVAQAQTETVLHNFGSSGDGSDPQGSLISDAAGNLYGTTNQGGASQAGTVFKLSPGTGGWTETLLYNFTGGNDGRQPSGGLLFDTNGNFYGATSQGGLHNLGVIYKLAPVSNSSWKQTVVFNFSAAEGGVPPYAWYPFSLNMDGAGNLYGVTLYGIKHPQGGTVFKLSHATTGGWTHSVIYEFTGGMDGQFPSLQNLTFGADGKLYGTTRGGGTYGSGVVFRLTPTSSGPWTQTILHTFTGGIDGGGPNGGLIFDNTGNLYGTTSSGGSSKCYPGCGVVFKLTPTRSGPWIERDLYVFQNGEEPYGGLIFGPAGSLYGTTYLGGASGSGTVFKLSPTTSGPWTETVLHSFAGFPADGEWPHGTLLQDSSGNLFGTAFFGGTSFGGVVFEVTP